jgi:myo-inositol-1(or 4)-monophosphatase
MSSDFVEKVLCLAQEAGKILTGYGRNGFSVENKQGMEFVTEADLESERFLMESLTKLLPGSSFLGEESWDGNFPSPPLWIVDPLDGTNNFAMGIPFYCVSIALMDCSGICLGCIHDPVHGETFLALRGEGAFLNGESISVSGKNRLSDVILATGFPYTRTESDLTFDLGVVENFLGKVRGLRRCGSAALDLAYTAAGRLGGFWEENLKPWDMAAGVLLVKEAGGMVTGFRSGEWTIESKGVQCAAPGVWEEFRGVIEKGRFQ